MRTPRHSLNTTVATSPFLDILLVVQFNSNDKHKLTSILDILAAYAPLFREIVFTASIEGYRTQQAGSFGFDNPFGALLCPGAESGFMAYECLSMVARRFPGRKGYLMVHFDLLANWPAIATLPQDRVWAMGNLLTSPYTPFCRMAIPVNLSATPHALFEWSWMQPGVKNSLTNRPVNYESIWAYLRSVPPTVQEHYHAHCRRSKLPDGCAVGPIFTGNQMLDILYIPARHLHEFQQLSRLAFNANLFLEYAATSLL